MAAAATKRTKRTVKPVSADQAAPDAAAGATSSVNADEIAKFSAMADEWWDPRGKFRPLHKFNPVRLAYIRDTACRAFGRDPKTPEPLKGLRLLDIGCGGGLVSEPMARLGAEVVGADAAERNVKTAAAHAARTGVAVDYRHTTAEALAAAGETFDIVLNLEVVEHVENPAAFLETCAGLVRPGGLTVVATLNRTTKAFALAIVGAEYVLRWLPRGTHEWSKFLKPEEVERPLTSAGLEVFDRRGVSFNPLLDEWRLSKDTAVNYMIAARRPG